MTFLPRAPWWPLGVVLMAVLGGHLYASPAGEPFKNHDETRHVMTGVFFHDLAFDLPTAASDPKGYAVRYYTQYPALGLLAWPPLFHMVEGLAMTLLGTSYLTARAVLTLYVILAAVYAYRLAARTHGPRIAIVSLAVLMFSPVVFDYSRYVLLEVPTLALVLGAVFHFERYLTDLRARDAWLACLFAAAAALTRFDGILLLPYVLIRLTATWNFALVLRRPVVLGVAAALLLTVPYYLLTWREYGTGVTTAAAAGTAPDSTGFLDPNNFWLYPAFVYKQMGWVTAVTAGVGLVYCLFARRAGCGPYFGLVVATYVTFVPLAEPDLRHAIYWVPALAVFATILVDQAYRLGRPAGMVASAALVGVTAYVGIGHTGFALHGYADAARYVVANRTTDRPVLFEGVLTGGFVYQIRQADPDRRLWVLRGDKLFYAVLSDPHGKYEEFAGTDADVLAVLHEADPEYIVVEEPQLLFDLPAADRLRAVLRAHPSGSDWSMRCRCGRITTSSGR
ncbi:ArnT family glycosyltransferase [Fimbriiglobus ruber]|uniref:4-amino-4-deoxy-L-arabinose transferase n=1 Tax=Fimbriiglobus ruber TaxID=1908690 RepID=A0A225DWV1_9BACT|nr:glycosyltransferase family 39 protein [Fimbriiglobus ruber]OWK42958.1 4-amino-4-deoxy-L-arabinose transferase [Fimbriiglobus ruber]